MWRILPREVLRTTTVARLRGYAATARLDLATPGFETAAITRNTSGTTARGATRFQPKGGLQATNVTLAELIKFAYQRHFFDEREVIGGPAWVTSERFDLRKGFRRARLRFRRSSPEDIGAAEGFPG